MVGQLAEMAASKGCTPAQLSLAWVLSKSNVVPIPGTKREKYLEENVQATDLILTENEIARLNELFKPGIAAGERFPLQGMMALDK